MEIIEELSTKIAGEISLSENPSKTIKKWRELFGVTQSELARHLDTTPSVVCDYESGRRKSPGTKMVKKFVEAVIRADAKRGFPFVKSYEKSQLPRTVDDVIIDMREFNSPMSAEELCRVLDGDFVSLKEYNNITVYGYTVIDSIKAILKLSSDDFLKLYGATPQRVLIFTKVSYGRSPLIAVRVSSIAETEKIPIIKTMTSMDKMINELRRYAT
jgi:putative transcriptional regulator